MPDPTLSDAIKEAYACAPSGVVVYHTIELNHASFSSPVYVVRDRADLTATLETGATVTFVGYGFDLVRPEVGPNAVPQCTVEIDNVDRVLLAAIQGAMASTDLITLTYREYLSSDLSAPQNNPPMTMTISAIKATPLRISATAGFGDFSNRRFPAEEYTAARFPGLLGG